MASRLPYHFPASARLSWSRMRAAPSCSPSFVAEGSDLRTRSSLFKAERDLDIVSDEYGIPRSELEDVLATLVNIH